MTLNVKQLVDNQLCWQYTRNVYKHSFVYQQELKTSLALLLSHSKSSIIQTHLTFSKQQLLHHHWRSVTLSKSKLRALSVCFSVSLNGISKNGELFSFFFLKKKFNIFMWNFGINLILVSQHWQYLSSECEQFISKRLQLCFVWRRRWRSITNRIAAIRLQR